MEKCKYQELLGKEHLKLCYLRRRPILFRIIIPRRFSLDVLFLRVSHTLGGLYRCHLRLMQVRHSKEPGVQQDSKEDTRSWS